MSSSDEFNIIGTNGLTIPESNNFSINATPETAAQGLYLVPSLDVPGRSTDITGYILTASNSQGKLEWDLPAFATVPGVGSVWFSNTLGFPIGNDLEFYWDNTNFRLALALGGVDPDYTLDLRGGAQIDDLNIINSSSSKISIQPPTGVFTDFTMILPNEIGMNGQFLSTDGVDTLSWKSVTGGSVGGVNTSIQYNDNGNFGGDTSLTWDGTVLQASSLSIGSQMTIANNGTLVTGTGANQITLDTTNGQVFGVEFIATSDERLKSDIKPLINCLNKVNFIKPYSYVMKNRDDEKRMNGVMAQQLLEMGLGDMVFKKSDGYYGVDYLQLIPLLIGSIQELSLKLNKL